MDKLRLPAASLPGAALPVIGLPEATLAGHPDGKDTYIEDGLVFRLDGIDKGPTAGAWIDLVGGIAFKPGDGEVTWLDNGVGGALAADIPLFWDCDSSTVEVVAHNPTSSRSHRLWFYPKTHRSIAAGAVVNKDCLCIVQSTPHGDAPRYSFGAPTLFREGDLCLSANRERLLYNGFINDNVGNRDHWYNSRGDTAAVNLIGDSLLHSVRVYDRLLSEEEMRHNQRVDVRRFGLTLADPSVMTLECEDSKECDPHVTGGL